jgi:DNA-binding LacI/PurR family transcriptional regulator
MQDVAEKAKVSKASVSFAFNDPSRLSEPTVRRIMEVAQDLGYSSDPAARMLRTRRTNSLGILLPQQIHTILENPYYNQFLQGVGQTCHDEGFTLLLVPPLRGSMLKAIPTAAVDGFVVSGLEYDRGEVSALRRRGVPFVLVDSELREDVPSVEIDDSEGVAELVRHLLDIGHRRIAIVAFETGTTGGYQNWRGPVRRRADGAISALASRGMTPESDGISLIETACTRAGGVSAFRDLWAKPDKPTAIVAFSDIIALGVLDAAREEGVSVPDDLSVSGFDDLPEASWTYPALTTIRQPIVTKGRLAADYLVEAIGAQQAPPNRPHRRLPTTLLLRDSVAPYNPDGHPKGDRGAEKAT